MAARFPTHCRIAWALAAIVLLCRAEPAAAWDIPHDVKFRIVSSHSGLCWDVWGGTFEAGRGVQQFPCGTGPNQQWTIEVAVGGYHIVSANRQFCLGISPARQLTIENCASGARTWNTFRNDRTGRKVDQIKLAVVGSSNDCVDIPFSDLAPRVLQVYTCTNNPNQSWLLLPLQ